MSNTGIQSHDVKRDKYKSFTVLIILSLILFSLVSVCAYLFASDSKVNELSVKDEPKIYIQWEDFIPGQEPVLEVNKKAWNNTVLTVKDIDNKTILTINGYSANDTSSDGNAFYAFIPSGYTEDYLNSALTGLELKLVGSYTDVATSIDNHQRIASITLDTNNTEVSGYDKLFFELGGHLVTQTTESYLNLLNEISPFDPVRDGKVFTGWGNVAHLNKFGGGTSNIDPTTGDRYYYTRPIFQEDKKVTVLWKTEPTNDREIYLHRITWNNTTCTVTESDGSTFTLNIYSLGNQNTAAEPDAYVYLSASYTEEYVRDLFIGSYTTWENSAIPINPGYVKDISADLSATDASGYIKYKLTFSTWKETVISASELSNLRSVQPEEPKLDGYHFDGWTDPEEIRDDYYVTNAKWTYSGEDPDDLSLAPYCAKYGDILVFGRGTVYDNYQGVPLEVAWTNIQNMGENIPWAEYSKDINEINIIGKLQPISTANWFEGFENLTSIDISKMEFVNHEGDFHDMFKGCSNLARIDLSNWIADRVVNTTSMFEGCSNLNRILVNENWTNEHIQLSENMFEGCYSIRGQNGFTYDTTVTDKLGAVLDSDMSPGYFYLKPPQAYVSIYGAKNSGENLTMVFGRGQDVPQTRGSMELKNSYFDDIESLQFGENEIPWKNYRDGIVKVEFDTIISPTYTNHWFEAFSNLKTIDLDSLDSSGTISFQSMFNKCFSLESVNFANIDTGDVENWGNLFYRCNNLKKIDLSKQNMNSATSLATMFWECESLVKVDFGYNTMSKVKAMNGLFYGCKSLTELDLSAWITSKVENIGQMFQQCTSLKTIYASNKFVTTGLDLNRGEASYINIFSSGTPTPYVGGLGYNTYQSGTGVYKYARIDFSGYSNSYPGYFTPKVNIVYHDKNGNVTDTIPYKYGIKAKSNVYEDQTAWSTNVSRLTQFTSSDIVTYQYQIKGSTTVIGDINLYPYINGVICDGTQEPEPDTYTVIIDDMVGNGFVSTNAKGKVFTFDRASTITLSDLGIELKSDDYTLVATISGTNTEFKFGETKIKQNYNLTLTTRANGKYNNLDELISSMSLREKVAQMFCVYPQSITLTQEDKYGTATTEISQDAINCLQTDQYPFGGACFFKPNIEKGSTASEKAANAKAYTSALQANSRIPMFLTIDEEGGNVARIGSSGTLGIGYGNALNSMSSYAGQGVAKANSNAKLLAQNCKALGFNWDFAPVADVVHGTQWQTSSNPIWNKGRYYSTEYAEGASLVSSAIQGFHEEGIATSIKHFPGHGSVGSDSHFGAVVVSKTKEELMEEDWVPFKAAIDAGTDAVMIGHLTVPAIEDKTASVSKTIVTDILRNELGFDGVIVTDAMNMTGLVSQYGSGKTGSVNAAVDAIKAGNDLILMAGYPKACIDKVIELVENNDSEINMARIDASVKRLLTLKYKLGLLSELVDGAPSTSELSVMDYNQFDTQAASISEINNDEVEEKIIEDNPNPVVDINDESDENVSDEDSSGEESNADVSTNEEVPPLINTIINTYALKRAA